MVVFRLVVGRWDGRGSLNSCHGASLCHGSLTDIGLEKGVLTPQKSLACVRACVRRCCVIQRGAQQKCFGMYEDIVGVIY